MSERTNLPGSGSSAGRRVIVGESVWEYVQLTLSEGTLWVEFDAEDLDSIGIPLNLHAAAAALEDALQREMAYGLGDEIAEKVAAAMIAKAIQPPKSPEGAR